MEIKKGLNKIEETERTRIDLIFGGMNEMIEGGYRIAGIETHFQVFVVYT